MRDDRPDGPLRRVCELRAPVRRAWRLGGLAEARLSDDEEVVVKVRKKPVEVEAVQWDGIHFGPVESFSPFIFGPYLDNHIEIPTLEGRLRAEPGDWIIRGIKGEIYSCKPDIFEKTYEAVE